MPELRQFQREDVEFLKEHDLRVLVASAPGTGKTPVSLRSIAETYQKSLPALVVCPASVLYNWAREAKKWAPGVKRILVHGPMEKIPYPGPLTIYVTSWNLLDARWPELAKLPLKTLVADEAHFCKEESALRSTAFRHLVKRFPRVMLLTGTPLINTKTELAALKDILGSEEPPMIRRLLEDIAPDVPPKKRSYLYISLRPRHREDYDRASGQFEDWLRKEKRKLLDDGLAEADVERSMEAESLVRLGYLRRLVGESKVPAASDWVARAVRIGEPVVVFAEHQAVLQKLSKSLRKQRIRHCLLDGSTPPKQRQVMIDQFQANKFPVFLGSKAAKEGITLHAARHVLFVERFLTSAEEEQAEDRVRRIGQKHPVNVWFLHAVNTVDDRLDTIVRQKRRIIREAIGSANVAESPEANVRAVIGLWASHVSTDQPVSELGLGEPLPPLPRPPLTHAVVFQKGRWTFNSAKAWCLMNGYAVKKLSDRGDRFVLSGHSPLLFKKGSFQAVPICRDIKLITGERLSEENERRVRSAMRRR